MFICYAYVYTYMCVTTIKQFERERRSIEEGVEEERERIKIHMY